MTTDSSIRQQAEHRAAGGSVQPTSTERVPLGTASVRLTGGILADWQLRNRTSTVPHTIAQLDAAGTLENFRRIVDADDSSYNGRYPFLDTDVYKTIEGIAYHLGRGTVSDAELAFYNDAIDLIIRAQRDDGYLNTRFQGPDSPKEPWSDLAWGHELYNLGHLIQAAVACAREAADSRLLAAAVAFADLAVERFGGVENTEVCGHPEVEMALVELFRETRDRRYLDLATAFVDRRGHGSVAASIFPSDYFQDDRPLRELDSVEGHAVRMVYLAAGAADVAVETGDLGLLGHLGELWDDMTRTKLHITGGLGSRHSDEAIGDRYELTPERSYSETCAAIGTMQWGWRMFLATGEAHYLDGFETVLYNAYAVGISVGGDRFFYDNPLQRRPDHRQRTGAELGGELLRRDWFGCACCPPNLIRWMAQLQDYIAVATPDGVTVANYASAEISAPGLGLRMSTSYPWDGHVEIVITDTDTDEKTIRLRVPQWAHRVQLTINGVAQDAASRDGWLDIRRAWSPDDLVQLTLAMPVRAHASHPTLDATRGAISIARGPMVYCLEQADSELDIDDLRIGAAEIGSAEISSTRPFEAAPDGSLGISLPAVAAPVGTAQLYPELGTGTFTGDVHESSALVSLIPYFLWGNREAGAMRVWLHT